LLDQVVAVPREPGVREEAVDLGLSGPASVDVEVGVVAVRVRGREFHISGDLDLGRLHGEQVVLVVEGQRDLAFGGRLLRGATVEEQVGQAVRSERFRARRTEDEEDGVGDVGLPHAVRAGHAGEPGLEGDLGGAGERLEVPNLHTLEIHRSVPPDS
jgi:hypothetical protein